MPEEMVLKPGRSTRSEGHPQHSVFLRIVEEYTTGYAVLLYFIWPSKTPQTLRRGQGTSPNFQIRGTNAKLLKRGLRLETVEVGFDDALLTLSLL